MRIEVALVVQVINMNEIILKGNVNWCKHKLHPLKPLNEELHPDEKTYRFITDYHYEILRHEITKLPIGIAFTYGPILYVGEINEQIGMCLKEICPAFDKNTGEFLYYTLIFNYDIPGNN